MDWEFVKAILCHVIDIFVIVELRNDPDSCDGYGNKNGGRFFW